MLVEISCPRFRKNPIHFEPGLNVVLGDSKGSNSIGKSTLLMLVDFAHGGNDFLTKSPEVVQNLGSHEYVFTFLFQEKTYVFTRRTDDPGSVVALSGFSREPESWSKDAYTEWLGTQYGVREPYLTFRGAVSPHTRVWKRETLAPERPLQTVDAEAQSKGVDRLLMLFGAYEALKELESKAESVSADKKNLNNAQNSKFIARVSKREYVQNQSLIKSADAEIERIRESASALALNIRSIVNDQALEASLEKDRLLKIRLQLVARRQQVQMNLDGVGTPRRQAFEALREFFPDVNQDRLARVEKFHHELAQVLRKELKDEQTSLDAQLSLIDGQIEELDRRILPAAAEGPSPKALIDRVISIAADAHKHRLANEFYEKMQELTRSSREIREVLDAQRDQQLQRIERIINERIRDSAERSFPSGRRAPQLELSPNKYVYNVDQDTGTGTAFASVVLLDLALLDLTSLPYLVHDSVLLKNIEVPVMAALIRLYLLQRRPKQVFIAIDEAAKYGSQAHAILSRHAVIELSKDELLYDVDWRTELPSGDKREQ